MDGVHHVEATTLKVEKKLLAEITDLKQQLEDINSDTVATEAEDLEHVDPEQVAQKEQAASIASRDRCKPCEAGCSVQEESSNQAEVKAEIHVKKKTLKAQETKLSSHRNTSGSVWSRPRFRLSRSACTLE